MSEHKQGNWPCTETNCIDPFSPAMRTLAWNYRDRAITPENLRAFVEKLQLHGWAQLRGEKVIFGAGSDNESDGVTR